MPSINLPKKSTTSMGSIYAPLGLKDMPFPSNGFVNPHSPDPKINGAIYAVSTAKETIAKFESLLITSFSEFPYFYRRGILFG